MVTRLLNLSGLYLGSEDDMMPLQAQDNPAGYWENLIFTGLNDDILAALGGSWDHPTDVDPEWWKQPSFDAFCQRATALITDFGGRQTPASHRSFTEVLRRCSSRFTTSQRYIGSTYGPPIQ